MTQSGIIGMDLDNRFAQISFWAPGADKPETLSQVVGGEDYMIPAVLLHRADRDVWLYGKDAVKNAAAGNGRLVDGLLELALKKEQVEVDGGIYEGTALLALFVKRSLSMLGGAVRLEKAGILNFTLERVDEGVLELVRQLAVLLELPQEKVSCQSRAESFFYYNINQPRELWQHPCMICDFGGSILRTAIFEASHKTRPVTVTVREKEYPQMSRGLRPGWKAEQQPAGKNAGENREELTEEEAKRLDEIFESILKQVCSGRVIDTIYLIGDGFDGSWYKNSLKLLCRGRRVFLGNNLYSKGACYGGRVKCQGGPGRGETEREYVYLGNDMLRANVGLEALRGNETVCLSLLEAGANWFDARGECDFLLEEDHSFTLRVTPIMGGKIREVIVTLDGAPDRPARTTRIHLAISCTDADTIRIRIEDRGFGELFPASGRKWEESFSLELVEEKKEMTDGE